MGYLFSVQGGGNSSFVEVITWRKAVLAAEYFTCNKISSLFIQYKQIWTAGKLRRNGLDVVFLKNEIAGNIVRKIRVTCCVV